MAVNKVIYDGTTLIDLTNDTVTSGALLKGHTAHDKSGAVIVGTYEAGMDIDDILENGFGSGDITYVDDSSTVTATNNTTGQVLTKVFADNEVTTTLSESGTTLGTLVRTYNDDYSVITSVNSYTGLTSVKTFDYANKTMTLNVTDNSGATVKSLTKSLVS